MKCRPLLKRRAFLGRAAHGAGAVALATLASGQSVQAAPQPGVLGTLPLPQKAKRVIWLSMAGGPSHLETFDPKPKLVEMHGQPMPESLTKGQQIAQLQGQNSLLRPAASVRQVRGQRHRNLFDLPENRLGHR